VELKDAKGGGVVITDGRYTIQAAQELDDESWGLCITGTGAPSMAGYIAAALGSGSKKVGFDASTLPLHALNDLEKALGEHQLIPVPATENILDEVWEKSQGGRPAPPTAPAAVHPEEVAGRSVADKISVLRADIAAAGADAYVASSLDEVNWLLNIRGGDMESTPVAMSFLIVTEKEIRLYIDQSKVTSSEVKSHLASSLVSVHDYSEVYADVASLAADGIKFMLDPGTTSVATKQAAGEGAIVKTSPVALPKAVKNTREMAGMSAAHVRDGAHMARTLCWLESAGGGGAVGDGSC